VVLVFIDESWRRGKWGCMDEANEVAGVRIEREVLWWRRLLGRGRGRKLVEWPRNPRFLGFTVKLPKGTVWG
jgi:hypothetical protein